MPENQSPAPLLRLASNAVLKALRKAVIKIDADVEKNFDIGQEVNANKIRTKRKCNAKRCKSEKGKRTNELESSPKLPDDNSVSPETASVNLPLEHQLLDESTLQTAVTDKLSRKSGLGVSGLASAFESSPQLLASSSFDISQAASLKVAKSIMTVKNYLRTHLSPEVQIILLNQGLTYSVMSQIIPLIRFLVVKDVDELDFRGTNFWTVKNAEPSSSPVPVIKSHSVKTDEKSKFREYLSILNPPNEFDWYSADRLGRPMSMNDAIELFSIIRSVQCGSELKSLMINGRRGEYFPYHKESMSAIDDTFNEFRSLTKLLLRGMADDNHLKIIGKTMSHLKILDVSCSKFVTDEGIRSLFYEHVVFTPVLYAISSYVQNSVKTMNPIVNCLELFDFSYTSVTNDTLTFVKFLPRSFTFHRLMAHSAEAAFGHVLFIRDPIVISTPIHLEDSSFYTDLSSHVGITGQVQFSRCSHKLFWKKAYLTLNLIEEPSIIPNYKFRTEKDKDLTMYIGIITSTAEDKLVQGLVKFRDSNITFLYNISPVSINIIGEACPKLECMQTILTGTWSKKTNIPPFVFLTKVNIFAEPSTIASILEVCPCLVKVQFRVIQSCISDEHIISSIMNSSSRYTLEEFWIAPGSYKKCKRSKSRSKSRSRAARSKEDKNKVKKDGTLPSEIPAPVTKSNANEEKDQGTSQNILSINKLKPWADFVETTTNSISFDLGRGLIGFGIKESEIEDTCKLSMECAKKLIELCVKLKRLGDLTWWSLASPYELAQFCQSIKQSNSSLVIIFDDIILPDFEIMHGHQ